MSDTPENVQQPLSPHLQVYRLPLQALMSISHRVTGAVLAIGTLLVTAWLVAAAMGEEKYNFMMGLVTHPFGTLIIFGWSVALFYHMCNGIRHMIWDMGFWFKPEKAQNSSYGVLFFTALITIAVWAYACKTYWMGSVE